MSARSAIALVVLVGVAAWVGWMFVVPAPPQEDAPSLTPCTHPSTKKNADSELAGGSAIKTVTEIQEVIRRKKKTP